MRRATRSRWSGRRGSGQVREYPEVDRVAWVTLSLGRTKLLRGQVPFLDRLMEALAGPGRALRRRTLTGTRRLNCRPSARETQTADVGGTVAHHPRRPPRRERPCALTWVLTIFVAGPNSPAEGRRPTLQGLEAAIRASWSLETCDPTDVSEWTPSNPSRGQCAVTALVVHDLIGGELLEAEVHNQDGSRQGFHYWNRLAGVDLDLTRDQFTSRESRSGSPCGPPSA